MSIQPKSTRTSAPEMDQGDEVAFGLSVGTRPSRRRRRNRRTPAPNSFEVNESADPNESSSTQTVVELDTKKQEGIPNSPRKTIEAVLNQHGRKKRAPRVTRFLGYEQESKRPITCLAFVLPLLMCYEIGLLIFGNEAVRTGVDHWLHAGMSLFGMGQVVVLPLITIAVLIAGHHHKEDHWRVKPSVLFGMLIETTGLGLILFWAANAIVSAAGGNTGVMTNTTTNSAWPVLVAYVGSGIYEELIFRVLLLVPVMIWARNIIHQKQVATIVAVIVVSLFFAVAHYNLINPSGNEFELSSFLFRFFASIVFCVLFLFRGFGIAVGAHVAYDLWTQF